MSLRLVGRKFIGFEKALDQQARSFRDAGGDNVEMEFLDVEDLYERMISNDGCAKGESDIMMVCTDWYPTLCAANALVPLNDFINQNPPPDWPDGWTDSMLQLQTSGGRILGLPYHDGPEMFIYRRDLFEDESEKNSFRERSGRALELPKNWTEFLEVSQHFTRPDDGLHARCSQHSLMHTTSSMTSSSSSGHAAAKCWMPTTEGLPSTAKQASKHFSSRKT